MSKFESALSNLSLLSASDILDENEDNYCYPDNRGGDNTLSSILWIELPLPKAMFRSLSLMRCHSPSGIQARVLQETLVNEVPNMLFQSQRGTGKTLSCLLSLLPKLKNDAELPQGLILVSCVEEAYQVVHVAKKLFQHDPNFKFACLMPDGDATVNNAHLVVATPGSLLTAMLSKRSGSLDFSGLLVCAVDNADRLLVDFAFLPMFSMLISRLPETCQMLVSFTMLPMEYLAQLKEVLNVRRPWTEVLLPVTCVLPRQVKHCALRCSSEVEKLQAITAVAPRMKTEGGVIFCQNRKMLEKITSELKKSEVSCGVVLAQHLLPDRRKELLKFHSCVSSVLVTDLLYIDLADRHVGFLVNWDLPHMSYGMKEADMTGYVCLTGNVGRFGSPGVVLNLLADLTPLHIFELHFNFPMCTDEQQAMVNDA